MPFRICKSFEIESGHILSKHAGHCRFPHGHSRRIDVVLTAESLDANEMVCDFKAVKNVLENFVHGWDHALCLNTDDPQFDFYQKTYGSHVIAFAGTDPTTEIMARTIFAELQRGRHEAKPGAAVAIGAAVRIERVRVTETSSSWAEYFE